MGLGKKDIANNISSRAQIPKDQSSLLLESLIAYLKKNKDSKIKISKFGVFYPHTSASRIGRNPKTKREYPISSFKRLSFRASAKLKNILN
jgi:integration host factor subunit alpha